MLIGYSRRGTHTNCGEETLRRISLVGQKIIWAKGLKMEDRKRWHEDG
jgi:hypothetical protein